MFDSFTRNSNSGWGSADMGGTWTAQNAAHFSIDGNRGIATMAPGAGSQITLNSAVRNGDLTVDYSLASTPTGGSSFFEIRPRQISNNTHYALKLVSSTDSKVRADLVRTINGTSTTLGQIQVPNVSQTAGTVLKVRTHLTGSDSTDLKIKVWSATQPEPATWLIERSDSAAELQAAGSTAFYAYLSGSAPVAQQFRIDDLTVIPATQDSSMPTPEPTPTPVPVERQNLPAAQLNADTTGVPPGTNLTLHTGILKITKDGTVIDGLDIKGSIKVEANNVTIKNTRVRGQGSVNIGLINVKGGMTGLRVIDTEIYNEIPHPDTNGIMGGNFTLERVNIHHVVDQVHVTTLGNVNILHSWLHANTHFENDPNWGGGPSHDDNIQLIGGSNILVKSSRIEGSQNAAIMVGQNNAAIKNLRVEDNLIGGGACSINVSPKGYGDMAGYGNVISGNTFQRNQTKHPGCAVIAPNGSVPTMTNNVWAETGANVAHTRG